MNFEHAVHKSAYERVLPMMKELFGEFATVDSEKPRFFVRIGSALAMVNVRPWGDDDAVIHTLAQVVGGAEIKEDLLRYLLEQNQVVMFGAFSIDKDGDIFFDHTILAPTCDKTMLKATIMAVVSAADRYDDEIVQRGGGPRAADLLNK